MIKELRIKSKDPKKLPVPWWYKAPGLEKRDKIYFQPGLNVVVGPNGSGKSTVLRTIARLLHCEQGGVQRVTHGSSNELKYRDGIAEGVELIHSGCPVAYFDAESTPGLIGGMAGFDDDFFSLGATAAMFKGSSGQETQRKLSRLLAGPPKKVEWKTQYMGDEKEEKDERAYSIDLRAKHKWMKAILDGSKDVGKALVMIFDEPERALDTLNQIILWKRIIPSMIFGHGMQVIVTSHSTMIYDAETSLLDPHFIELEPDYVKSCREMLTNPEEAIEAYGKNQAKATSQKRSPKPKPRRQVSKKKSKAKSSEKSQEAAKRQE